MSAVCSHAVRAALLWQLRETNTGSLALCPDLSPEWGHCAGMHGGGSSVCACVSKTRVRAMGSHRRPGAGGQGHVFLSCQRPTPILSLIQGASREGDGDGHGRLPSSPTHLHALKQLAGDLLSRWPRGGSASGSCLWLAQRWARGTAADRPPGFWG